uniref:MPN domain-containing protein n=1 Tax=Ditylenchus dipsaci TaxID=166011 RepID=A0A915ERH2_9BILA
MVVQAKAFEGPSKDGIEHKSGEAIDEVDLVLAQQDGKILRKEAVLCRHPPRQKCTNCLPLDPYDEEYLKEKDIKHMAYHSLVRKLTDLHGKGSSTKPLENINCSLKLNCAGGHKPYPKGICTKCRPPTLTLMRQRFRHVDNITIENSDVVNSFLNFWRKSSYQRVGYLIGTYEPFADVPLGIKAVIGAVYEPPQSSDQDRVKFEADPNEAEVDLLCQSLGLKRVGWIFTDLWSADLKQGTVHCIRHEDSFLLSAAECITAGHLQSKHKNYTKFCHDGYFGSKFVTVVASGDKTQQIHFSGYQVSNQCTAMVEANILCPTVSNPELAWVREKPLHEHHYITDVQYTEKDEYGAEVLRNGRPMPVEYLLVDVPTGVPLEPRATFTVVEDPAKAFAIENRSLIGEDQSLTNMAKYIASFQPEQFLEMAANFHFLLFLLTNDHVKLSSEEVDVLAKCVIAKDSDGANIWDKSNENWGTLKELAAADLAMGGSKRSNAAGSSSAVQSSKWSCSHCTFENTDSRDCAMCGLPADS